MAKKINPLIWLGIGGAALYFFTQMGEYRVLAFRNTVRKPSNSILSVKTYYTLSRAKKEAAAAQFALIQDGMGNGITAFNNHQEMPYNAALDYFKKQQVERVA